jgi:hypothetical protein
MKQLNFKSSTPSLVVQMDKQIVEHLPNLDLESVISLYWVLSQVN